MLKNKYQIYTNLFFITIMLQVSVSCSRRDKNHVDPTKHPDLVDQSWLSDQPCSAPCWQGLEPGVSSREEAIETVQSLSFIQNENIMIGANRASFFCKEPSNIACVSMAFEDEKLSSLRLYVNYRLTLEQVVDKIGPPDSFFSSRRNPEGPGCDITLFWINRQMSIDIYYVDRDYAFICDSLSVERPEFPQRILVLTISYMTSSEMKISITNFQKPDNAYDYRQWNGFVE